MSSKSRKQSQDPRRKARGSGAGGSGAAEASAGHAEGGMLDIPDEILHAPKETSKLKFALMILLIIFLLVVFVAGDAFVGLGRGGGQASEAFTWDRPGHGTVAVEYARLSEEARALQDALGLDIFLGFALGIQAQGLDLEDAARFHVLDTLAADAGVRVPRADLAQHLKQIADFRLQGDVNTLRDYLARSPGIEDTIRRGMRIQRFLDLAAYAGAVPGPEDVVTSWEEEHSELALDYVAVDASAFEEAARAELPDDAELQAWFDGLSDARKNTLASPERRRVELVSYDAQNPHDVSALLAAFPRPEDGDPEELAREYYDAVFSRRFQQEPEEGSDGTEEAPPVTFRPFEEVRELCLREAPVYFAMRDWLGVLSTPPQAEGSSEEGGEPPAEPGEVDLLAESQKYGLSYLRTSALTREEAAESEDFEDSGLLASAFFTQEGRFGFSVVPTARGLAVLRVAEVEPPVLPEFGAIVEEVRDLWVDEHLLERGREALQEIWESFPDYEPDDEEPNAFAAQQERRAADQNAFLERLTEAGYTVEHRDWLDYGGPLEADPRADDPDHAFLHSSYALRGLDENEVAQPLVNGAGDRLYLVRCDGRRPVPLERMSPGDFESYLSRARDRMSGRLVEVLDLDHLKREYNLTFTRGGGAEADGDEDEAAAPAADGSSG